MSDDDELTARARKRVGTTIRGKYTLDSVIGVGGMASVYAATHRNRKRFAVKMLHPELSLRRDVHERFVREGYVANTIEHPNALAVLDDDTAEDGSAFVVMELLTGHTLDELCEAERGVLPARAVLAIAHELLDVLAAAHRKSIVHRDIKPANVFVLVDGTVKVLDFGIARLRDAASVGATTTGMMLGTPAFLPPEQALAQSSEIDNRTDIWAVGATLFTLLSGAIVHEGNNGAMLVVQTATRPARSLAIVASDVPAAVVSIVDKALQFEKSKRWESSEAMREAIRVAYQSCFGETISKAPIAALMAKVDLGVIRTESGALDSIALGPTVDAVAAIDAADTSPEPSASRAPGITTAQPVSHEANNLVPREDDDRRSRISRLVLAISAAGTLVIAIGVGFKIHGQTSENRLPPIEQSSSAFGNGVPNSSVLTGALSVPAASAVVSSLMTTSTPSASPSASAIPSQSSNSAKRRMPAPSAKPATSAAIVSSSQSQANCDPPFTINSAGHHVLKPGCE